MDITSVLNGFGAAGKIAICNILSWASRDEVCRTRCAAQMYQTETKSIWPPANTADRVMWEQRAANAIIGLKFFVEGK